MRYKTQGTPLGVSKYSEDVGSLMDYTIRYVEALNVYMPVVKGTLLETVVVNKHDYYKLLSGERTHVFPNYDPKIHIVKFDSARKFQFLRTDNEYETVVELYSKNQDSGEDHLPNGVYKVAEVNYVWCLKPLSFCVDNFIKIRSDKDFDLVKRIEDFKNRNSFCEKENIRNKNGILFYGPPGNGKTLAIETALHQATNLGILGLVIPSNVYLGDLEQLKNSLTDRFKVLVLEEISKRTQTGDMDELLSFLDGENSWPKTLIVATTNYPKELPANIIDRPGRFNSLIRFDNPNEEEIANYLRGRKLTITQEVEATIKTLKGLSIDYIAQIVNTSKYENISLEEASERYKKQKQLIKQGFGASVGISRD